MDVFKSGSESALQVTAVIVITVIVPPPAPLDRIDRTCEVVVVMDLLSGTDTEL